MKLKNINVLYVIENAHILQLLNLLCGNYLHIKSEVTQIPQMYIRFFLISIQFLSAVFHILVSVRDNKTPIISLIQVLFQQYIPSYISTMSLRFDLC